MGTNSNNLTAQDIKIGRTYRAKRPTHSWGVYNDRTVVWISSDLSRVQYDGPTVKVGMRYPTIPMERFLKWCGAALTDQETGTEPAPAPSPAERGTG